MIRPASRCAIATAPGWWWRHEAQCRASAILFTEGLVAFATRTLQPHATQDSQFAKYARIADLRRDHTVYGTSFAATGRTDLQKIFIPEVLKVATTTDAVRVAGQTGFNRLGFIGGDTTNGVSGGWPNGRRFGDDVVDIALTAIASGPAYSTITVVGDNIASNDIAYQPVFPYLANRIPSRTTQGLGPLRSHVRNCNRPRCAATLRCPRMPSKLAGCGQRSVVGRRPGDTDRPACIPTPNSGPPAIAAGRFQQRARRNGTGRACCRNRCGLRVLGRRMPIPVKASRRRSRRLAAAACRAGPARTFSDDAYGLAKDSGLLPGRGRLRRRAANAHDSGSATSSRRRGTARVRHASATATKLVAARTRNARAVHCRGPACEHRLWARPIRSAGVGAGVAGGYVSPIAASGVPGNAGRAVLVIPEDKGLERISRCARRREPVTEAREAIHRHAKSLIRSRGGCRSGRPADRAALESLPNPICSTTVRRSRPPVVARGSRSPGIVIATGGHCG